MTSRIFCLLFFLSLGIGTAAADSQAPNSPSNVQASSLSSTSIRVTWNRPWDNTSVLGYNIYRDGSYITTVHVTNYVDYNAVTGRSHRYAIEAFDPAINFSPRSTEASATAGGGVAQAAPSNSEPGVPAGLRAQVLGDGRIQVSWNAASGSVDGYNVFRDNSYVTTIRGATTYIDSVSAGRNYSYTVHSFRDAGSRFSDMSDAVSVNSGNTSSTTTVSSSASSIAPSGSGEPGVPAGLRTQVLGDGRIQVSWNTASGSVDGYNVFRDYRYVTTVRGSTSWIDSGVSAGNNYSYQVGSFRDAGSRYSDVSDPVFVNSSGNTPSNDDPSGSGSAVPAGYRLIFSEEFNGSSIDSSKWNTRYRWGPNWVINNEQQYYVDTQNDPNFGYSPFELSGGKLSIKATRTPSHLWGSANSQPWLSGALTSYGKFKMRYGYIEMRAKMPKGQGLWPAFWLLNNSDYGREPEIDIVELLGRDPFTVYQTYHYYINGSLRSTKSHPVRTADFTSGYHTYAVKWEPGRIIWYVDGQETHRLEDGNVSWEEMYIKLNLAIGGSWGGNADGSTPSPSRFVIDYIRAYQQ